MKPKQLRLFEPTQPLVDRFGPAFFRHLPRVPGVYWFADADGRLLYVGKARDLRRRLGSYRQVEGQAPKTARMVHRTTFIRWESCPTEAAALEREAELIRVYQPPFNRAGKWTGGRKWVWLEPGAEGWTLRLEENPSETSSSLVTSGQPFGRSAAGAFVATLRLLTLAETPDGTVQHLPRPLLADPGPRQWSLPTEPYAAWFAPVQEFVGGNARPLLERFQRLAVRAGSPFDAAYIAAELDRWCEATGIERDDPNRAYPSSTESE